MKFSSFFNTIRRMRTEYLGFVSWCLYGASWVALFVFERYPFIKFFDIYAPRYQVIKNTYGFIAGVLQGEGILLFANLLFLPLVPAFLCIVIFQKLRAGWRRALLAYAILLIASCIFHLNFFLSYYRQINILGFDFYFFWYNKSYAFVTFFKIQKGLCLFLLASFLVLPLIWMHGLKMLAGHWKKSRYQKIFFSFLALVIVMSVVSQILSFSNIRGEFVDFLWRTVTKTNQEVARHYESLYKHSIQKRLAESVEFTLDASGAILGQNIFLLELESVNAQFVNETTTPHMLRAAREGIFFPKFYGNSMMTIRGQESVVCGMAPGLTTMLVDALSQKEIDGLFCMPDLFKKLGYKTLFFQDMPLNSNAFMDTLGFDEAHAGDIMKPGDRESPWGYEDGIFFKRIFEYLKKYKNERVFVYIAVSSSNHFPFTHTGSELAPRAPYKNPKGMKEKFVNSLFAQDAYFGEFFQTFSSDYAYDSTLMVLSDHSWPMELERNNFLNESGAYEQNFLIPFVFIPPQTHKDHYKIGSPSSSRYSQIDILPTLLNIIDPKEVYRGLGETFAHELLSGNTPSLASPPTTLSVQPYHGGFISLVRYPEKYVFNLANNTVEKFDLEKDPGELSPEIFRDPKPFLHLLSDYFAKISSMKKYDTNLAQ